MAASHRNGIALSGINAINGIAKTGISAINGEALAGGGGGSIAVTATAAGTASATSVTASASPAPSGSNRAVFGATLSLIETPTDMKYGGSGGTSLTQIGSTLSQFFGVLEHSIWGAAASPSGATDGYAAFSGSTTVCLGQVYLSGVNQTTPFAAATLQTGGAIKAPLAGTTLTGTLSWTGLTAGDTVVAGFSLAVVSAITVSAGGSANGATTTVHVMQITGDASSYLFVVSGTADGSGNLTLAVQCTLSSDNEAAWCGAGLKVNP